jgi:hypothetical protein
MTLTPTLRILGGSMPSTAANSEAVGWFFYGFGTPAFTDVEFSVDGTTWEASPALAGGFLVATAELPNYVTVRITPTEDGTFPFFVRLAAPGAGQVGPAFEASLVVVQTISEGFFNVYNRRTSEIARYSQPVATNNGFVIAGPSTTTTGNLAGEGIPDVNGYLGGFLASWSMSSGTPRWVARVSRSGSSGTFPYFKGLGSDGAKVFAFVSTQTSSTGTTSNFNLVDSTGNVVYTGNSTTNRDVLVAFDAVTGVLLWTKTLEIAAGVGEQQPETTGLPAETYFAFDPVSSSLYVKIQVLHPTNNGYIAYYDGVAKASCNIGRQGGPVVFQWVQSNVLAKIDPASGAVDWVRILTGNSGQMAARSTEVAFSASRTSNSSNALRLYGEANSFETWSGLPAAFTGLISVASDGSADVYRNLSGVANVNGVFAHAGNYVVASSKVGNTSTDFGGITVAGSSATGVHRYVVVYEINLIPPDLSSRGFVPVSAFQWGSGGGGAFYSLDINGSLLSQISVGATSLVTSVGTIAATQPDVGSNSDVALAKIDPITGNVAYAQHIFRDAEPADEFASVVGPTPSGGGVGVISLAPSASATELVASIGDNTAVVPSATDAGTSGTQTVAAIYTFNELGEPGNLPDVPFAPPPGSVGPAPPFVSINWPSTGSEDIPVNATATVTNPEVSQPELPTEPVVFDPSAGTAIPGAVTNLTATAGNTQAFLSWNAVAGAAGYRVYLADLVGDIFVVETSAPSYVVTNLANGTSYTYRVEAVNAAGPGSRTSVTATPSASGPFNQIGSQWTGLRWELWDPAAGVWFTGTREFASDIFGRGTFTLVPHNPSVHTDPAAPDYVAPYTADVRFEPAPDWFGTVRSLLRVVATRDDGVVLTSAPTALVTVFDSVYDRPTTPEGSMPDILENQVSVGTWTTTSPENNYFTWELSQQVDDPYTVTSSTSITVLRSGTPVGTAAITGGQGSKQAQVSFTPLPNFNGSFNFSLRVGDGGDDDDDGWTSWVTVTVNVGAVSSPPSAPFPSTMPTIAEDEGPAVQLFTVTDVDVDPGGDAPQARWEIAPAANNNMARRDFITLSSGLVEIIDEDEPDAEDDLTASVRYTPALNFHGTYAFFIRAYKETGSGRLTGPWTRVTGVVTPVDDRPTPPLPRRMPTVELGQVAIGTFTTFDPDGAPWTWQVSATQTGTWGSSASLSGVGTVAVSGTTTTSQVTFVPDPAYTGGTYAFWLRVTDATSLTSDPVRIRGAVAVQQPVAFLTLLNRTETSASLDRVGTLPIVELSITDSVTGPGGASITVPTAQLRDIAESLNWTVDELLYPGGIELHLAVGPVIVFAGPVTDHRTDAEAITTRIDADGLASYLRDRAIEGGTDKEIVGERADEIMVGLLADTQGLDYGELLITDETTPVGDPFSQTFEAGDTLASIFDEVGSRLGGPEWWINADRELRTAEVRGSDLRDAVLLTDGCAELEREVDDGNLATVAEVDGNGVLGSAAAASTVLARFGRRYVRLAAERLDTDTAADALAAQHVADFGTPIPSRKMTHYVSADAPVGPFDYQAGDAIRVESTGPSGLERVGVRVINRTARLVGPGAWVVESDVEVVANGPLRPARSRHLPSLYNTLYDAVFRR